MIYGFEFSVFRCLMFFIKLIHKTSCYTASQMAETGKQM